MSAPKSTDDTVSADRYTGAKIIADLAQLDDYAEISEVLRSRKFVQGLSVGEEHMMSGTLSLVDGEQHMQRKRLVTRLFDDEALAGVRQRYLIPVVEQCLAEIAAQPRAADGSIHTDLAVLVQRCLHRLAAALAGLDGLESVEAADRFVKQVQTIAAGNHIAWSYEDPQVLQRNAEQAREALRQEVFVPSFARREALIDEARAKGQDLAGLADDFISMIILHRSAWEGDEQLPLREVCTFLVAASQTTAQSLVLLILRLEKWFSSHPEDRRLIEDDPEFLRRASFDSLRMTVASPARIRKATEDVRLSTGREIKAGERVALLFIPANMNPALFGEDAADFNPHRKIKTTPDQPPWGLAFGGGAHSCPGRPLVTGSRSVTGTIGVDGTMVSVTRRFYAAGLALIPERPPVRDTTTHYQLYTEVPVKFTRL